MVAPLLGSWCGSRKHPRRSCRGRRGGSCSPGLISIYLGTAALFKAIQLTESVLYKAKLTMLTVR